MFGTSHNVPLHEDNLKKEDKFSPRYDSAGKGKTNVHPIVKEGCMLFNRKGSP